MTWDIGDTIHAVLLILAIAIYFYGCDAEREARLRDKKEEILAKRRKEDKEVST